MVITRSACVRLDGFKAEDVMFYCLRFVDEGGRFNDAFDVVIESHNLMEEMVRSEINWTVVSRSI